MYFLGFDTTGEIGSVGCRGEEGEEMLVSYRVHKGHFEHLDWAVEEILQRCKLDINDVTGVVVVSGPGYYTGIRVGAAYAKGLAVAAGINIAYVDTFTSALFSLDSGRYLVAVDMGRGCCCVAAVNKENTGMVVERISEVTRDALLELKELHDGTYRPVGRAFIAAGLKPESVVSDGSNALNAIRAAIMHRAFVNPLETHLQYECPAICPSTNKQERKI